MKHLIYMLFILSLPNLLYSQHHNGGYLHYDSLEIVTKSGRVIVNESQSHAIYYLDENNDGEADYQINFGPYWYEPDSSSAVRPSNEDNITVTGGLSINSTESYPVIIVYEINDQFWRDPYFANWNNMGTHNHYLGGHHGEEPGYYGFGWQHDTLETVMLSGQVLVDTTYFAGHYYLDANDDNLPDFIINFGPPWYVPESGIDRPLNGDQVYVLGGKLNDEQAIPMLIVYELNGELWRDSSSIGPNFGGGWFHRNLDGSMQFHAPFDTSDKIIITEGWGNFGPGGGHMMPDSLFCQILEINPENLHRGNNIFAGYEIHMFRPDGTSGMMDSGGMMGSRMSFASNVQFQLHYTDAQLEHYNINEETVSLIYWDNETNSWLNTDFEIDRQNNLVSFSSSEVSNYLALTAEEATGIITADENVVEDFILEQNYPNPFNPSTTISFQIKNSSHVELNVFNMLGEKVTELVNRQLEPGKYEVDFVADVLPSGLYFYRLNTDIGSITKVMVLIK
jgi:hypothetical protein